MAVAVVSPPPSHAEVDEPPLDAHGQELRAVDPEVAAYVLVTAVDALMHRTILEPPPGMSLERMAEEVVQLVLRYVER